MTKRETERVSGEGLGSLTFGGAGAAPSIHCERCGGEGKLYTSRYGGNDPDVWPIGTCPVCEGSGYTPTEDRT